MHSPTSPHWIAFGGRKHVASGPPRQVAERLVAFVASHPGALPQVFDADTSTVVEVDLRGSLQTVLRRLPREAAPADTAVVEPPGDAARGPGRPKLGVVAREVTLLPRHWEWLTTQPGGASVALRKLVEQALRVSRESERARRATEAAYRFMQAMAGDEPGFEEASRALFAGDGAQCVAHMARWPRDVRAHAERLVERIARPVEADAGNDGAVARAAAGGTRLAAPSAS